MEIKSTKLKCRDAEFSCDSRLLNFSQKLSKQISLASNYSSESFAKVQNFYSSYDFDPNNFSQEQKPIISNNFKDNLSPKDLETLKESLINESELRIYNIKELIELAYGLEFVDLKKMLLTALATHFKCGMTEEDILNYKIKNGLEEKWIFKEEDIKKNHKESLEKLNLQIQEILHD